MKWLKKSFEARQTDAAFQTERLLLDVTEQLVSRLERRAMKRAELAKAMSVDRALVTRVLRGDHNVTIRTLVAMATALGARLRITVEDLDGLRPIPHQALADTATTVRGTAAADVTATLHEWLNSYAEGCDVADLLGEDARASSGQQEWTSAPARM